MLTPRASVLTLASLLLCGCGGHVAPSPFQGGWSGTWAAGRDQREGGISFTVSASGQVTGSMHDNSSGKDGSLESTISDRGSFNCSLQYAEPGTRYLEGAYYYAGSGRFHGYLNESLGFSLDVVELDMVRR